MSNSGDNCQSQTEEIRQECLEQLLQRIGKEKSPLLQIIGKEDKPLNVAIIGTSGSGKSSFINTFIASITGEWRSFAMAGSFGGKGDQKTKHFAIYRKKKYLEHARDVEHLMEFNFPTIIDMSGFSDVNDKETRKLLELVFSGRVPEDSKIEDILKNIRNDEKRLSTLYPFARSNIRVDRIIFVVSASNESLPEDLMQVVHTTSTSGERDIPIFGVLTKLDDQFTSEDNEFKKFVTCVRTHLGILDIHLLRCTNYCDVNLQEIKDGIRTNLPEIDISCLRGMKQILDPSISTPKYNRVRRRMDTSEILMIAFVILVIAICIMLFWK